MKNSKEQKILGVAIDSKLKFESYIKNYIKNISLKIGALPRFSNHLNVSEKIFVTLQRNLSFIIVLLYSHTCGH